MTDCSNKSEINSKVHLTESVSMNRTQGCSPKKEVGTPGTEWHKAKSCWNFCMFVIKLQYVQTKMQSDYYNTLKLL